MVKSSHRGNTSFNGVKLPNRNAKDISMAQMQKLSALQGLSFLTNIITQPCTSLLLNHIQDPLDESDFQA
jgi:hypothetical protein